MEQYLVIPGLCPFIKRISVELISHGRICKKFTRVYDQVSAKNWSVWAIGVPVNVVYIKNKSIEYLHSWLKKTTQALIQKSNLHILPGKKQHVNSDQNFNGKLKMMKKQLLNSKETG